MNRMAEGRKLAYGIGRSIHRARERWQRWQRRRERNTCSLLYFLVDRYTKRKLLNIIGANGFDCKKKSS